MISRLDRLTARVPDRVLSILVWALPSLVALAYAGLCVLYVAVWG